MKCNPIVRVGAAMLFPFALAAQASTTTSPQPAPAKVPFGFASFTWLNGNSRQDSSVFDSKYFTGEFRADVSFIEQFNHPSDHTLVGTSESGRTSEVQVQQLGVPTERNAVELCVASEVLTRVASCTD